MRAKVTRAGEFRTRVIVCRNNSSASANTDGEVPESEEEVCRRWASIWPVRGRERDLNDQMQADVTHTVRLRYDTTTAAITPKYWLKVQGTTERLNVSRAYDPDRRRREIHLECVQRL